MNKAFSELYSSDMADMAIPPGGMPNIFYIT